MSDEGEYINVRGGPHIADGYVPQSERDEWRALADDLYAELKMARDDVADWSMYADQYFRDKHNLAGDLARIDAALARYREAKQR